jgi:hypothetical protein
MPSNMSHLRRNSLGLLLLVMMGAFPALPGCGEEPPPPVETEGIDFQAAEDQATKEYGGE